MALTIRKKVSSTEQATFPDGSVEEIIRTVTKEVPLTVPTCWCMYSPAGDRKVTAVATRAVRVLEMAVDAPVTAYGNEERVENILVQFLVDWLRLGEEDSSEEASDTAVREAVGNFHDDLALASGYFHESELYRLWDKHYNEALNIVSKRRK